MKHKIITRKNKNHPHQEQYQLRWYVLGGLVWDIMPLPNSLDSNVMKYPANIDDIEDWVDSKEMIYKYLELKDEYNKNEEKVYPPKWKIVKKERIQ